MPTDRAVLYVEDEPLLRALSSVDLKDAGFEVIAVASAAQAFAAMIGIKHPFCALVTDIDLGDGPDGWAVARRGRELNRALPVIFVTGASAHLWQSEGVPHSLLIQKPFTSAQIVEALYSLLQIGMP